MAMIISICSDTNVCPFTIIIQNECHPLTILIRRMYVEVKNCLVLTLPSSTASVPAAPSAAAAALVAPELEQPLVVVDHLGNLVRQLKGERLQPRGLRPMHHLKQRGVPIYTIHATAFSCYLKSENEIRSL